MDHQSDQNAVEQQFELIDQTLGERGFALHFPRELEKQFEEETGPARERWYVRMGLLSLGMSDLLIALDYFSIPDAFGLALVLRLGLMTALTAGAVWITMRHPPAFVREGMQVILATVMALVVYALVASSTNPLRENYHLGILFVMMMTVMVLRLRWRYAVLAVITTVTVQIMTLASLHEASAQSKGASAFLSLAFAGFSLMALYSLEKMERQGWLRSVRDRLCAKVFEEMSIIDPLTGLGNRRALEQWVNTRRKANANRPVSVVMVDVDYFKAYNDTFGHVAGDDCLRRVSGLLVSEARKTGDRVCRFGGEEFLVFLIDIDLQTAITVAERMRREIAAKRIPHKTPTGSNCVTASFGIATGRLGDDFDLNALIEEADSALYKAKQRGRNCVEPPLLGLAEPLCAAG